MSRIYVVIMGGSVNNELNIVRPMKSGVRYFNLLPVFVVVGNGSVEHAEALWGG